ncbi:hypothetical protein ACJ41O_013000 [Fusarium nematophilum]
MKRQAGHEVVRSGISGTRTHRGLARPRASSTPAQRLGKTTADSQQRQMSHRRRPGIRNEDSEDDPTWDGRRLPKTPSRSDPVKTRQRIAMEAEQSKPKPEGTPKLAIENKERSEDDGVDSYRIPALLIDQGDQTPSRSTGLKDSSSNTIALSATIDQTPSVPTSPSANIAPFTSQAQGPHPEPCPSQAEASPLLHPTSPTNRASGNQESGVRPPSSSPTPATSMDQDQPKGRTREPSLEPSRCLRLFLPSTSLKRRRADVVAARDSSEAEDEPPPSKRHEAQVMSEAKAKDESDVKADVKAEDESEEEYEDQPQVEQETQEESGPLTGFKIYRQLTTDAQLKDNVLEILCRVLIAKYSNNKARLLDPLWFQVKEEAELPLRLRSLKHGQLMIMPIHHPSKAAHWSMGIIRPSASHIDLYLHDSMPSPSRNKIVSQRFKAWMEKSNLTQELRVHNEDCPEQTDGTSCGVYSLACLRRVLQGEACPGEVDPRQEREELLSMLLTADESPLPPTDLHLIQDLQDLCNAPSPGRSLNKDTGSGLVNGLHAVIEHQTVAVRLGQRGPSISPCKATSPAEVKSPPIQLDEDETSARGPDHPSSAPQTGWNSPSASLDGHSNQATTRPSVAAVFAEHSLGMLRHRLRCAEARFHEATQAKSDACARLDLLKIRLDTVDSMCDRVADRTEADRLCVMPVDEMTIAMSDIVNDTRPGTRAERIAGRNEVIHVLQMRNNLEVGAARAQATMDVFRADLVAQMREAQELIDDNEQEILNAKNEAKYMQDVCEIKERMDRLSEHAWLLPLLGGESHSA